MLDDVEVKSAKQPRARRQPPSYIMQRVSQVFVIVWLSMLIKLLLFSPQIYLILKQKNHKFFCAVDPSNGLQTSKLMSVCVTSCAARGHLPNK